MKNAFILFLASSLTLIVGLLLLEIMFGDWFAIDPWKKADRANLVRNQKIAYDVSKLGFSETTVIYTRDKYGLRGTCEDMKNVKIVAIGGSTTDQRYITDGKTWTDLLQGKIRRVTNNSSFCITNAGINGHSTVGHIYSLENWMPLIPNFKPDFYILYLGINDAGFHSNGIIGFDPTNDGLDIRRNIKIKSALYRLYELIGGELSLKQTKYAGHTIRGKNDNEYIAISKSKDLENLIDSNSKLFELRLMKIISLIKKNGGLPICVSQPHVMAKRIDGIYKGVEGAFSYEGRSFNGIDYSLSIASLNKVMAKLCPLEGGVYIDMANQTFSPKDFYDYTHMNERGVEKVADYLFEKIEPLLK